MSTAALCRAERSSLERPIDMVTPEEIDLDELRRRLAEWFQGEGPAGYVPGKSALRAAVVALLECSELEAEELIDTLESRLLIRYEGDPAAEVDDLERRWRFDGGQPI
jgi:hypothetical protein